MWNEALCTFKRELLFLKPLLYGEAYKLRHCISGDLVFGFVVQTLQRLVKFSVHTIESSYSTVSFNKIISVWNFTFWTLVCTQ